MHHRGAAGVFAFIAGCSGQPAPVAAPPPAPSVTLPTTTEPEPPAPTVAEEPRLPTEIVEPSNVACRIVEKSWDHTKLYLRVGSASFGRVQGAPGALVVPVTDKPTEAIAVFDDEYILLRAVLPAKEVGFYMPKPTALLGILTLEADMSLGWLSSTAGTLRAGLDASQVLLSPDPFQVDLACGAVSIVEGKYDARASITKQKKLTKRDTARDGVEIHADLKGRATATLKGGLQVGLVEMRGADVRILIETHGYFVSGWVARKDLVPSAGWIGAGYGKGTGYGRGGVKIQNLTRCSTDIDLFIEQGTDRMQVGLIHKGAQFRPKRDADPALTFTQVEVPDVLWLWLDKSSRLVVDTASIKDCTGETRGF